jgi:hypothetical protein
LQKQLEETLIKFITHQNKKLDLSSYNSTEKSLTSQLDRLNSNITDLDISGSIDKDDKAIGFLTNLQTFTTLKRIIRIDYLDFLLNLKWVSLCGNFISEIRFLLNLPKLEVVTLSNTNISLDNINLLKNEGIETSWYWYEFWQ